MNTNSHGTSGREGEGKGWGWGMGGSEGRTSNGWNGMEWNGMVACSGNKHYSTEYIKFLFFILETNVSNRLT